MQQVIIQLKDLKDLETIKTFYKSADNKKFYGETKLAELKKEKDQLLLKNIYIKK